MTALLGKDLNCSIARSLEVLGEKWTLLIVREAFRGRTRFSEFTDSLGIARDILATRLSTLVEFGVLERHPYRDAGEREREEYLLTTAGRELMPVLAALTAWGDRHRPTEPGPTVLYEDADSGARAELRFTTADGRILELADVAARPGPGQIDAETLTS
ncbi:helix-turn-helix transcriptional regulator [Herbiconiux sp. CPCC 205763]|uniref:Helix-turn-helix transcriptional regulator n=1 Tax=Herbiconiux aconitum TaxID=2970913 RepID=A0ABT2GUP3_9MICO|nr:helix-turn-helix domain-containing protein [Herbiconiux aconitum]MCS5719936.1 helix-turn-helix transcriptional regulator [Herbiconiux aconitum]